MSDGQNEPEVRQMAAKGQPDRRDEAWLAHHSLSGKTFAARARFGYARNRSANVCSVPSTDVELLPLGALACRAQLARSREASVPRGDGTAAQ
jgi:hypothetical protein